jgi:Membrane carboxypeptidase/penicillin-binding protein
MRERIERAMEREEEALSRDFEDGVIDRAEYERQLREIQRAYRAEAEDAAQGAYDREMSGW